MKGSLNVSKNPNTKVGRERLAVGILLLLMSLLMMEIGFAASDIILDASFLTFSAQTEKNVIPSVIEETTLQPLLADSPPESKKFFPLELHQQN